MNMIFTDLSNVSRDAFHAFITKISNDFIPPLLPRIEIDCYYEKLRTLANAVVCLEREKVVGLAVTYCNNIDTKQAYIPFVGVDRDYRGCHIATTLIEKSKVCATQYGMSKIGIHTNNPHAKDLYIKCGFKIIRSEYNYEIQVERYYLEIEL